MGMDNGGVDVPETADAAIESDEAPETEDES